MTRQVAMAALLAITGCSQPVSYVTLSGRIVLPVSDAVALQGAPISIASLAGNLARSAATSASQDTQASGAGAATGNYSLEIDASTLPTQPTLFVVQLLNPDVAPRNGPLLASAVTLSRPGGKGPNLGSFTADLDATTSVAAMALEYRQSLALQIPASQVDPVKIADYLSRQTTLPFDFQTACQAFLSGQSSTAPASVVTIARNASQALPQNLTAIP